MGIRCKPFSLKEEYTQLQTYTGKIMYQRLNFDDIVYYKNLINKYMNVLNGLSKRKDDDKDIERISFIKELLIKLNIILKGEMRI